MSTTPDPPRYELSDIRARVARLASVPASMGVFGASGHGFTFSPPLAPSRLAQFEVSHNVRIPDEYATFLTEVGNGGAGPGYGLFPLGMVDDIGDGLQPWNEYLVGNVSRPFPHTRAWNLPAEELEPAVDLSESKQDEWFEQRDRLYFSTEHIDGAIPLAHLGCAIRIYLIVSGPRAGHIWTDDRASDAGIYPCTPRSFLDWYLAWLDESEGKAGIR